jgi:5-methylcytosine-specific restriction endonuclease McrA
MTETGEERRMGRRRLSFAKMMRIVRRDDYRCQHCQKQLQDNEVEFDHIIPVSKGGSSEEHNIRLTCFDCNRDKSDDYIP